MPIDGVTEIEFDSTTTGAPMATSSLCATSITAAGGVLPLSSTTNSSPPKRATRSPARSAPVMRCATVFSSASPTRWPSESLTRLKWSRSMNSSASVLPWASACGISASMCSMNAVRLGSPVSASWCARWWMRLRASRRSRRSRTMVMRCSSPWCCKVRTMNSTGSRVPSRRTSAVS